MNSELRGEIGLALGKMGISFRTVFPDDFIDSPIYENHNWLIVDKSDEISINAIPKGEVDQDYPYWEQWIVEGSSEPIHRLLFDQKPKMDYHDIFDLPKTKNNVYPDELGGKRYFVVELFELTAYPILSMLYNI